MRFTRIIAFAATLLAAPSAYASTADYGQITRITPQGVYGVLFFDTVGTRSTLPNCASGGSTRWVVDVSSSSGQALVATLLTAFALHKPVHIVGSGTCSNVSDIENVTWLTVES